MKIATPIQHRALAFIEACNGSGYSPTPLESSTWLASPDHTSNLSKTFNILLGRAVDLDGANKLVDHLASVGWTHLAAGTLKLSRVGQAILLAAERNDTSSALPSVVVLDSKDPLAYAKLIGHLAKEGPSLLVDPYFRIDQLMVVLEKTKINRILISRQHKDSTEQVASLSVALSSSALPREVEIRASVDPAVHERLLITDKGNVYTLGISLNSVSGKMAVISPLPTVAAHQVRLEASKWWSAGSDIKAKKQQPSTTISTASTEIANG